MKVGILARYKMDEAVELASKLAEVVTELGHELALDPSTAEGVRTETAKSLELTDMVSWAELVVTLGGDGTLLGLGRLCDKASAPALLGVNFGTLGFLTEFRPKEAESALKLALEGKLEEQKRILLAVSVEREGEEVFRSRAMNDAVIQKGTRDPLLALDFYVGEKAVSRVRADGVIVSSPTGSTAYSLAAGGAILYPSLEVLEVTPICPHSLTSRPLVLPLNCQFSLRLPEYRGEVFLSLDGQESFDLLASDCVKVVPSRAAARVLCSPERDYFEILSKKLNWGMPNKNE